MSSATSPSHPKKNALATTPWKLDDTRIGWAQTVADWFEVPYVERRGRSVAQLFRDEGSEIVIVADEPATLYHRDAPDEPLFFHPGMATQRIHALARGERDRMVEVSGLRRGDTALDATMGLGIDSLVMSHVVGPEGRVIGIESSWYLARLLELVKHRPPEKYGEVRELFAGLDIWCTDHASYLSHLPDSSIDVIFFDPMFRLPPKSLSPLNRARPFTNKTPLSDDAWQQAKRVARRCVVLKERPGFGQFERLRVKPDKSGGRFAFGVYQKEASRCFPT